MITESEQITPTANPLQSAVQLSICIATYNRAAFIGETLDSIIPQLTDAVELLVVDGNSTDNTEEVLRHYQEQDSRILFVRLPVKGGVDQDFCRAVELARGDYCWLFTDDDILKPGAVAAVLRQIVKDPSLVVINAEARTPNLTNILAERILKIGADEVFAPDQFESLFLKSVSYLSFIGGVVIKRSLWLDRETETYWGTEFIHVGVIFQAPLPGSALLLAEPFIVIRYGNAQWTPRTFNIWMLKWPRLLWSFTGISANAKRSVIKFEPWRSLKEIFYYRALGALSFADIRNLAREHDTTWRWRFSAEVITCLPGMLVNTICLVLFKLIRGNSKKLVEFDLKQSKYSLFKG